MRGEASRLGCQCCLYGLTEYEGVASGEPLDYLYLLVGQFYVAVGVVDLSAKVALLDVRCLHVDSVADFLLAVEQLLLVFDVSECDGLEIHFCHSSSFFIN